MDAALLRKLVTTPGISGREERIRALVCDELAPLVDEVRVDPLGNIIGVRRGSGPKTMLCAHMDSIGFLVASIDDKGFLRLSPVGGFDVRTLVMQRVLVQGGRDLVGIVSPSAKPIHISTPEERDKAPKLEDLFVDLMLPAEEVKQAVSVGDPVVLLREPLDTGRAFVSPYLDDRLGVYVLLQALREAKGTQAEIQAVVSVQEEVGLRGAQTSAFSLQPDIGVALDVTFATDLPGMEGARQAVLDGGVALSLMDAASISDPRLVDHCKGLAERHEIPYQLEVGVRGGTDAGGMQLAGVGAPVLTVSFPIRYIHTSNEMVLRSDVDASVALTARFLETAHEVDLSW